MEPRSATPVRIAKAGYIAMSLVLCVIGLLFILPPAFPACLLRRILGAAMLVFGGVKLGGYFSRDLFRLAFQYDLESGVVLLALGLAALLHPAGIADCIALGVASLTDGLFKIRISAEARQFGIASWRLILSFAIATVAAGLLLLLRPGESAARLSVLLGINLLAEGVLSLCVAVCTVKIIKHQLPD